MGIESILGNLIVLVIVTITLIIFRRSDKNSKSLEQVKLYADRRHEEFDLYVEEKMTQLKDLTINLDVQEKTGSVILRRIEGEVDHLSEKISHIEELNKKVMGYNSTMEKMLDLSKELDERYTRIKKESGYIDTLDKRVKDGKKKLYAIEKSIDDITSEFIKNNNVSVNKIKDDVLSSATQLAESMIGKVNETHLNVDKLDAKITELDTLFKNSSSSEYDKFHDALNILVEGHRERIHNITQEGESLEKDAFMDLKERIDRRSDDLISLLNDKMTLIESENSEKISKLSMDMGNVEQIAEKISSENQERLDSIKVQLDKQLLMLKEINTKGIQSLQDDLNSSINEIKDKTGAEISNSREESLKLISELTEKLDDAQNVKSEVEGLISSTESYVQNEVRDIQDSFDNSLEKITDDLDRHEERVRVDAFKHLEENLHSYKDEVEHKLRDLTSVKDIIEEVKGDISSRIKDSQLELERELEETKNSIVQEKEILFDDVKKLKGDLETLSVTNDELIKKEKEQFMDSIKVLKESHEILTRDISESEQEIRSLVSMQRDRLIEQVNSDITERLEALKLEFKDKLNSVSDFDDVIKRMSQDFDAIIMDTSNKMEFRLEGFNTEISERMESEESRLKEFTTNFNEEREGLESQLEQLKQKSLTSITEKLDLFEDDYFKQLKEKENFITTETDRWKTLLDQSINEIKDESIATILTNMESFNSEVNEFKTELNKEFTEVKRSSEERLDKLISDMQHSYNDLTAERDGFRSTLEEDIKSFTTDLKNIRTEVDGTTESIQQRIVDISKAQEQYISDTEIFTRVDSLKSELEKSIDLLNTRISEVSEKSNFVQITNEKLSTLRDNIDGINRQLEEVEGRRIKIESLEGRVSKVLNLSDSVDEKLSRIKDSESEIDEIQLRLRELKELEDSVKLELSRLEGKNDLLAETTKAIDTGFSDIQVIENRLDLLKESLNPFNSQIEHIQDKLSRVEGKEEKVNIAIDALSTLDSSISDMEEKIIKMDKAREWIAGVETRLNESVRTADEQVKLMGALSQNRKEKDAGKKEVSAPNMNMRDMVIKLAHNGWKAEDIARTTKLSRGEVELILELSPRK